MQREPAMTDIPEDIREAARACLTSAQWNPSTEDAIAQALLSERMKERERCAQTAKLAALQAGNTERRTKTLGLRRETYAHEYGNEIASAIRSGE